MSLASNLAADMAAAAGDYEQTFEWNGNTYACVRNNAPEMTEPVEGGRVETLAERIVVSRSAFTGNLPQIGDPIDNGALQIKSIEPSIGHIALNVDSFDK